jgi:alpha-galactosidase
MTVDPQAYRFILFAGHADTQSQSFRRPLRAAGFAPEAVGRILMEHGFRLPNAVPASMTVIEGQRVAAKDN